MNSGISVVIPVYNSRTLIRALESVVNQTLKPKEIIIIDDGSNSHVPQKKQILKLIGLIDLTVIRLDINKGAGNARYVGVKHSKYRFIAFLDSDDVWHSEKLSYQYQHMLANNIYISGTLYDFNISKCIQAFHNTVHQSRKWKMIKLASFIFGNPYFTPTVMVDRLNFINFNPNQRILDDYECWYLNVKKKSGTLIELYLSAGFKYPIGESGLTSSTEKMHKEYMKMLFNLKNTSIMPIWQYIIAANLERIKYPIRLALIKMREMLIKKEKKIFI